MAFTRSAGGRKGGNGSRGGDKGNEVVDPMQALLHVLKIGLYGGVIWGLARWAATGMNFTEVHEAFLIDPFVPRKILGGFYWQTAGWIAFILMSVAAAFVYWLVLGRLKGPWPGLLFGMAWWGIVYAWLGPIIGAVQPLRLVGWNSLITDFCMFSLWGLFIGYSISFELHDEAHREPKSAAKSSPQPS